MLKVETRVVEFSGGHLASLMKLDIMSRASARLSGTWESPVLTLTVSDPDHEVFNHLRVEIDALGKISDGHDVVL